MTKAKKKHLLKIQAVFGGSIDWCKRNFRVDENGIIQRTYYDIAREHQKNPSTRYSTKS